MKINIDGKIPPNFWKGLVLLCLVAMGANGGDLIGLV
jgi:hypothetical protein